MNDRVIAFECTKDGITVRNYRRVVNPYLQNVRPGWATKELRDMTAELEKLTKALQKAERSMNRWHRNPGLKGPK